FFSSRRRHTRSKRDWSSDVCSSDLLNLRATRFFHHPQQGSSARVMMWRGEELVSALSQIEVGCGIPEHGGDFFRPDGFGGGGERTEERRGGEGSPCRAWARP